MSVDKANPGIRHFDNDALATRLSSDISAVDIVPMAEMLSEKIPPLLFHADKVARTVAYGLHGRRQSGYGDAFWQYRAFQSFDSYRQIDWRRSAQSDDLFVRETEWEAAQSVFLWRDASSSMAFTSDRSYPTKQVRADLLTVAFAALLLKSGERVGGFNAIFGQSSGIKSHKALLGQSSLPRIAGDILSFNTPLDEQIDNKGVSRFPDGRGAPRHAVMALFSDMFVSPEVLQAQLSLYAAHGIRGHICQILDPAEEDLPYQGHIRFAGLEGEEDRRIDRVEAIRPAYQDKIRIHCQALRDICRYFDWTYTYHRTDSSPESALLTMMEFHTMHFQQNRGFGG